MFIARNPSSSGSVRKSGVAIPLRFERMPLFRQSRVDESRRAINIASGVKEKTAKKQNL
jgi:hypothetical protein